MIESPKFFNGNMCFICHLTVRERELKKCSCCKLIFYCSKKHQKMHWKEHKSLCQIIQNLDLIILSENLENNLNWYKYRSNLLILCEMKLGRHLRMYENHMILFPNNCQICHKMDNLEPCLNCLCVSYCSSEHREADFEAHKDICQLFTTSINCDLFLEKYYTYPDYLYRQENFALRSSINEFLESNILLSQSSLPVVKTLISQLITCPLTLLFAASLINFKFKTSFVLHVVGCSFLETVSLDSWEAILHVQWEIKNLTIHFIGPQVKENYLNSMCQSCKKKLNVKIFDEFYHDYMKNPSFEEPDLICTFNCGYHEFENSDRDTWAQTIPNLIEKENVPLIFSSYTKGEAQKDASMLLNIDKTLNIKIIKNKFSSLRPFRDFENSGVYFDNNYVGIVLHNNYCIQK